MIKPLTMYSVVCDRCGKFLKQTGVLLGLISNLQYPMLLHQNAKR